MNIEDYKKIEFYAGSTVEEAVNRLLKCKDSGILAYGEFNGTKLYSDIVTMDSAYKEITGKTKIEFDKEQEEWRNEYNRKEKEYQDTIPSLSKEWMKKGRSILSEDKWELWDKIVPIRLNDLYHGMELGCCLNIVKILNNNGTLEEAKQEIENQHHSGWSFRLVCSMIKEFCDRGNEFVVYVR